MMTDGAYKKDLWMWDQDWSIQTLKLKKQTKKKKTLSKLEHENNEVVLTNFEVDTNSKMEQGNQKLHSKEFEHLDEEYLEYLQASVETKDKKVIDNLNKKFEYLYEMGDSLPVKRPYLAGYPAWYRKLCTKPGKDPDWTPGANNITTSMQVILLVYNREFNISDNIFYILVVRKN